MCSFLLCARLSFEVFRKLSAMLLESDDKNFIYRESVSVIKSSWAFKVF